MFLVYAVERRDAGEKREEGGIQGTVESGRTPGDIYERERDSSNSN